MNDGTRRGFLTTAGLGLGAALLSPSARADLPETKRISVSVAGTQADVAEFIAWRLWDPYFLAVGIPRLTVGKSSEPVDLLILGSRGSLPVQAARGVIAIQPAALKSPLTPALESRFGVRFRKWDYETPAISVATEHPVLRHLARTAGQGLVPHLPFEWHMEVEPVEAEVVSRYTSGHPDILVHKRSVLITSNQISELLRYRTHPDILQFTGDLSAILVNLARVAAGAEPVTVPVSKLYLDWRDHFYGYGFGRQFITELVALKSDAIPPEAGSLVLAQLARSDELVAAAAAQLLREDVPAMQVLYREAAEGLLECRKRLTSVQPYFVRGWHGGLVSDQVVEGELVGYAEWGWPSFTAQWIETRLAVSERLGYKQINQTGGGTWDLVADHGLTDLERWKRASAAGLIETVKGMYSDAFLEVVGPESNIRQFEYGLKAFRRMSQGVRTFMVAADDYAFHPQLPQILRSFGFEFAVLRSGVAGRARGVDCEQLLWKGLDGTCIQTVPNYETAPQTFILGGRGAGISRMPGFLLAAEKAGFHTVVGGGAGDATGYMWGDHEYESLNSVVPVQAVPTTWPEYCQIAPIRPEPVFFGVDELVGLPGYWSGFGQYNDECHDHRSMERLLVAAEKFSALAAQKGRPYPEAALEKAWKYLLSSQDHFYAGPDNPWSYDVGGYHEMLMPGYPGPRTPITLEATFQRWKSYVNEASRNALEGAVAHLCHTDAQPAQGGAPHLVVFNPLNWNRQGRARAWIHLPSATRQVVAFDGEQETAALILEKRGEEALVEFQARVPSLGFRAYAIRPGSAKAKTPAGHLENRYLRVEVSPETGSMVSLFDKVRGKELLCQGEATRFECALPQIDTRHQRAGVKLDRSDALANRVKVQGTLAKSSYSLLLTLAHECPWLEADLEIDYGKGAIFGLRMKPQTLLRAVFPFSAAGTRWVNQPFGVYQTAAEYQVMLDFCDAYDGSGGVAILSDGMPGLRLVQGNVELFISDGFPPLRGVHRYRFAIYPHAGDWRAGNVLRTAHEFQEKLAVHPLAGAISLPFERSYLQTTDGVVLSALCMKDEKMHARFYDATGESRRIETRWDMPWKNAAAVRLDGQLERELAVDGRQIRFDLPAWRILTIAGGGQA